MSMICRNTKVGSRPWRTKSIWPDRWFPMRARIGKESDSSRRRSWNSRRKSNGRVKKNGSYGRLLWSGDIISSLRYNQLVNLAKFYFINFRLGTIYGAMRYSWKKRMRFLSSWRSRFSSNSSCSLTLCIGKFENFLDDMSHTASDQCDLWVQLLNF